MAALLHPPPRTPTPKVRIHRSQSSFDSPSSRLSVTPIEESPYSKSEPFISAPLPRYNALKAAERAILRGPGAQLHTRLSDDSMLSSESDSSGEESEISDSPSSEAEFSLFRASSPRAMSPPPSYGTTRAPAPSDPHQYPYTFVHPPASTSQTLSPALSIYQDPSTTMYDPWLVRMVLDLFDVRGFSWMMIAEPIERLWGFKTSSSEVLGILVGNGRVGGRVWWD